MKRKLILKNHQSPGDIVAMTATVRDLHAAHPGRFQTDVRTSASDIWRHNPLVTVLSETAKDVAVIDMHYPAIHQSNQRPIHFISAFAEYLSDQLKLPIPVTRHKGDIYLTAEEKTAEPPGVELGLRDHYWIICGGGKYDFTAKWWVPSNYQAVVNHFRDRIQFVQVGEAAHWHPRLEGVIDLVGKTSLRDLIRLVHHAQGVVCPVTLLSHLAAAVPVPTGRSPIRPAVVIAGGREPVAWEQYPGHQHLHNVGALACCSKGGCWKSRCQLVGDGDAKDTTNICEQPVQITEELRIPRCMTMIEPSDVIRAIERYYVGGVLAYPPSTPTLANGHTPEALANGHTPEALDNVAALQPVAAKTDKEVIEFGFDHGLGDCANAAHLVAMYTRRGYQVKVCCPPDKAIVFKAAGAEIVSSAGCQHAWGYPAGQSHQGHGQWWRGSKYAHHLSQSPFADIGTPEQLWEELAREVVTIPRELLGGAPDQVAKWLSALPRPIVALHTRGNSGGHAKSLPDAISHKLYLELIDRTDATLLLLDWDSRVPRLASHRVRHLEDLGPCPTETLVALLQSVDLLIGVDSGPLHLARMCQTPALGVWMPGHFPSTYSLPRHHQLNLVLGDRIKSMVRCKRIPWRIVEQSGHTFDPAVVANFASQMIATDRRRYVADVARDVQMRQWVGDWCRGHCSGPGQPYPDRHRSLDVLLRTLSRKINCPRIVETGCIRAEEDWSGAGYATYLLGAYAQDTGGRLDSVDVSDRNVAFAREWTSVFGESVQIHKCDSVDWLRSREYPIDCLYLDSKDTTEPGHAEHAMAEFQAAAPRLHKQSVVVVDDSWWSRGAVAGKGALVVPWMLANGWTSLYAGYQVVMVRKDSE